MYRRVVLTRKNQERSGSHCYWITDPNPDPALFFSGFPSSRCQQKLFFAYYLLYEHLHQSSKSN
jgi:hypothetical protein